MPRLPLIARALVLAVLALAPLALITTGTGAHTRFTAADEVGFEQTEPVAHPETAFALDSVASQTAQQIAHDHWGTDACEGRVEMEWGVLDDNVNAQSSWANPTSAYNNPTQNSDCKITFNYRADFDWAKFCTVMTHELGHLVGKPHAADSRDVMAAYYTIPLDACKAVAPDGAAATAPAPVAKPAPAFTASVRAKVVKKKKATKKHRKSRRARHRTR